MSLDVELQDFYRRHGFGETIGARPLTVPVYTGCMLVPLPNIETRHRYLKYHDLHHLVTGFSVGRIGEGQISAWELASGSMRESPTLGLMNLIALSTGWVLDRKKMWAAFCLGRRSRNLYSQAARDQVEKETWADTVQLRKDTLDTHPNRAVKFYDHLLFGLYVSLSLVIHAVVAIPAVIVRIVSDLTQGKPFRETLSPQRRSDLF